MSVIERLSACGRVRYGRFHCTDTSEYFLWDSGWVLEDEPFTHMYWLLKDNVLSIWVCGAMAFDKHNLRWLILRRSCTEVTEKVCQWEGQCARMSSQITSQNAQSIAGSLSIYANHPWLVTEPEAVGVPGWQTRTKALCLYTLLLFAILPERGLLWMTHCYNIINKGGNWSRLVVGK